MAKPKFDPSKPFEPVGKPKFDPNADFEELEDDKTSKLESMARGFVQGIPLVGTYADEITGGLESLVTDKTYKQARDESRANYDKAYEDNPASYISGQFVPSLAVAGLKAIPVVGTAASGAIGAIEGLGASKNEDIGGMLQDAGIAGGISAATAGLGKLALGGRIDNPLSKLGIGKETLYDGAGAIPDYLNRTAGKAANTFEDAYSTVTDPIRSSFSKFEQPLKDNADDILGAAERLRVNPTRGMLTTNPTVSGLESMLSQKPSKLGETYTQKYRDIASGLKKGATEVVEEGKLLGKTARQAGEEAQEGIIKKVTEEAKSFSPFYENIAKEAQFIPLNLKGKTAISKNIRNLDYAMISGSPEASFANNIANTLDNATNLKQIRGLKTYVGQVLGDRNQSPTMKRLAGEIYEKFGNLERNAILRASVESAASPKAGQKLAEEMIGQLKATNKGYREFSQRIKNLADATGMKGVKNYGDFIRKVSDLNPEEMSRVFFQPKALGQLNEFQKEFPEAFQTMRKSFLQDIYNKSITKGEVSLPKMINAVDRIQPEARTLIFGKDALQKLEDIKTVLYSMPEKVGPSGTPKGIAFREFNILSPSTWWEEISDRATDYMIRNPKNPTDISNKIITKGKDLKQAITEAPQAFGKYTPALQKAIQRGGNALGVTDFILQQNDPEYRKVRSSIFDEDQE